GPPARAALPAALDPGGHHRLALLGSHHRLPRLVLRGPPRSTRGRQLRLLARLRARPRRGRPDAGPGRGSLVAGPRSAPLGRGRRRRPGALADPGVAHVLRERVTCRPGWAALSPVALSPVGLSPVALSPVALSPAPLNQPAPSAPAAARTPLAPAPPPRGPPRAPGSRTRGRPRRAGDRRSDARCGWRRPRSPGRGWVLPPRPARSGADRGRCSPGSARRRSRG